MASGSNADRTSDDRRQEHRRWPEEFPLLATARLRPGSAVRILNWSARGALIEAGARLVPGAKVALQIQGPGPPRLLSARVIRAYVAAITRRDGVRYQGAITFEGEARLGVGERDE